VGVLEGASRVLGQVWVSVDFRFAAHGHERRDDDMIFLTPLADVAPAGDLRRRAVLNFQRLHEPPFRFEAMVVASTAKEAPGDWIGRAMLGLSLLGQVLRSEPHYLEEMMARLPTALNARGYIGELHAVGTVDENQVGGHNGLLRGLCEYYLWKSDPRALAAIRGIVSELMVPTRPLYAAYPDHKLAKLADGKPVGLTVRNEGVWIGLSTDIGTVFFTLDGLTQTYGIDPSPELRALIETMIARYAELDVRRIGAQTHSMLSTLRGILRWWERVDPRPELLALVRDRYALYRSCAETEHFANYNWFDRPEWTEACAVVDSFLLAIELWRVTGEASYLTTAHRVYFNALSYAQRPNGGYGCDLCLGAEGRVDLSPHPKIFEAPWCCSMRGAEGLARAAQANIAMDGAARTVWMLFYFEGDTTLRFPEGEVVLRCQSDYPLAGRVEWTVVRSTLPHALDLKFFVPPGVRASAMALVLRDVALAVEPSGGFVSATFPLETGARLVLTFPLGVAVGQPGNPTLLPGMHRFSLGPLLLGVEKTPEATERHSLAADDTFLAMGRGRFRCIRTGAVLAPFNDLTYRSEREARTHRTQVLFPD